MEPSHNLALSEEQQLVLDQVRKLVAERIEPAAIAVDEQRRFDRATFVALAEMGLLGLPVAEASGGAGLSWLSFAAALEELAKACGSTARLVHAQAGLCGKALEGLAAADSTCRALAAGRRLGAFVGPWAGIAAAEAGGAWSLTGAALLVTGAAAADDVVVAAVGPDGEPLLFCLEASELPRESVPSLGLRAAAPATIRWREGRAEPRALVARGAEAAAALSRAGIAASLGGAAIGVGLAAAAYERARRHAHERVAFGKPLFAQQAVRHKLVESMRRAEAARHLTYHAARLADAGEDAAPAAAAARLEAVEAAVLASDEAIQVHGGYGYTNEYHVERIYRDAKTLEVIDGGAEALRDAVAAAIALG